METYLIYREGWYPKAILHSIWETNETSFEIRCTRHLLKENFLKDSIRSRIFTHSPAAEGLDPNLSI